MMLELLVFSWSMMNFAWIVEGINSMVRKETFDEIEGDI